MSFFRSADRASTVVLPAPSFTVSVHTAGALLLSGLLRKNDVVVFQSMFQTISCKMPPDRVRWGTFSVSIVLSGFNVKVMFCLRNSQRNFWTAMLTKSSAGVRVTGTFSFAHSCTYRLYWVVTRP